MKINASITNFILISNGLMEKYVITIQMILSAPRERKGTNSLLNNADIAFKRYWRPRPPTKIAV
jgi:hypothetical protein